MMRKLAIFIVMLVGLGAAPALAQWSPTTPLSFPVGFDVPLNSSSVGQTKSGNLTVGSGYSSGTTTTSTDLVVNGQICWNSICKNSWTSVGSGNFAHLFSNFVFTPDTGYPELAGDLTIALTGRAGFSTVARPTSGIWARSSTLAGGFVSTGAFGDTVGGTVRNDYGYAVYGTVGSNTTASAATFNGKVRVAWPYDLIVGPVGANVQSARQNNSTSFVCLGDASGKPFSDVCKSSWETGGSSVWALNGTTVWPGSITHSVAVGGTGSTAKFLVDPHPDLMTDVSVSSGVTTQGMVIGTPSTAIPVGMTCGDGICNGVESPVFGNPNFCAVDCDNTAPSPVGTIAVSKNNISRTATFIWDRPGGDARGTLILQKINSPSSSPTDGTQVANILTTSCTVSSCTYTTPTLSANVSYYYTFFVYDYTPNYSTGQSTLVRFTSGGTPPPPPPPPSDG